MGDKTLVELHCARGVSVSEPLPWFERCTKVCPHLHRAPALSAWRHLQLVTGGCEQLENWPEIQRGNPSQSGLGQVFGFCRRFPFHLLAVREKCRPYEMLVSNSYTPVDCESMPVGWWHNDGIRDFLLPNPCVSMHQSSGSCLMGKYCYRPSFEILSVGTQRI